MNPTGTVFKSSRLALKHLVSNNGSAEDISTLREYLKAQGWKEFEKLPEFWFYKTPKIGRTIYFITETGDLIQNKVNAISHMRQCSYSEEQIEQFRSIQVDDNVGPDQRRLLTSNGVRKVVKAKKSKRKVKVDESWTEDDTVPQGWRQKIISTFGDRRSVQLLLSPSGQTFRGKREALRYLIENGHSQDEVEEMRNLLGKDGWISHDQLPENWFFKSSKSKIFLCSPTGQYFKSRDLAVRFVREKGTERELEMLTNFSLGKTERNPGDDTLSEVLESSDTSAITEMDESVDNVRELFQD